MMLSNDARSLSGTVVSADETEEDICAHVVVPASSRAQDELDDTKSEMECLKEELKEMRKMLEFLVRRERKVVRVRFADYDPLL